MSVHVDGVFMAGQPQILKDIKENIKENFNIAKYGKVNKYIGVYYEWGPDTKVTYVKMTMHKDVKRLVEGYDKYTRSDVKVHKNPGSPHTNISKSDLQEPYNMDK